MKNVMDNLGFPVLAGSLIVLPFLVLELINRRASTEAFPFLLFALMWLLAMIFLVILQPFIRKFRQSRSIFAGPVSLVLGGSLLIFIVWIWISVILH